MVVCHPTSRIYLHTLVHNLFDIVLWPDLPAGHVAYPVDLNELDIQLCRDRSGQRGFATRAHYANPLFERVGEANKIHVVSDWHLWISGVVSDSAAGSLDTTVPDIKTALGLSELKSENY